jgi:dihydroorotate dehydrogenase
MYRLLKIFLFRLDPEKAHYFTMWCFMTALKIPVLNSLIKTFYRVKSPPAPSMVAGLSFSNPIGLAAGFDKNARFIKAMAVLGFSHIEVGTVTPRPQPGNPKPRLFRLVRSRALINRMGFNNDGVESMATRLSRKRPSGLIIGANIGKNKDTPNENAAEDYLICFKTLYHLVDYFTVNVSSPNTPGLRELQEKEPLRKLLTSLQQKNFAHKPIFLKIAPDLTESQLKEIVDIVLETRITGIIATNTTIERNGVKETAKRVAGIGAGGLSGEPILDRAVEVIRFIRQIGEGRVIIVGAGGIHDAHSAAQHLEAGATLLQLYTGLIYEGPSIVKKILAGFSRPKKG